MITKGAPESLMTHCVSVSPVAQATLDSLFAQGMRVVAVATKTIDTTTISKDDETNLELAGFLTYFDRPRADAGDAIRRLSQLGIAVKIVTGDNGVVARKVCDDIGVHVTGVLTDVEVSAMDDAALANAIPSTTIFSRISPGQKARIITVARGNGADVAFLGDGVNDAAALHAADVGISVDSAVDVAKEAADIVLLDKSLSVLADGIVEGRRIFNNTLKYVLMATSSNFGNMFSAAGASFFLGFLPMLPGQVLLNNLLYDVGQMAIPFDSVDEEVLQRPTAWDMSFVRRFMITFGPVSSLFDFATFWVMLSILHAGNTEFRSGWFIESLATQTLVVYVIRTRRTPFFRSRPSVTMRVLPIAAAVIGALVPFSPLAGRLGFTSLPLRFFFILLGMIIVYLFLVEGAKVWFYARLGHPIAEVLTDAQLTRRHIRRRAHRFVKHEGPGPNSVRSSSYDR
jgi:Mg2+-importing ATPase